MWNLNYMIASFMIIAVFIGYFISLPRLPIRKNLIFIYVICIECLVMLSNFFSTSADMNHDAFSPWVLYALNSAFFILFFLRGFAFFIFTANIIRINLRKSKLQVFICGLPISIGTLLILTTPWTKWFYYIDENGYHNGPIYNILYPIFIFYVFLSFVVLYKQRSRLLRRREKYIVFWYNIILTVGIFIRFIFPKYLLMDIFCLMAMIVIFLSFENPNSYLEERTYIFNRIALRDYLTEIIGTKPINALVFCIHNYFDKMDLYGVQQTNQGIYLIEDFLKTYFPDMLIFDYRYGRFILFSRNDNEDWDLIYKKIQARFLFPWVSVDTELYLDIGATLIDIKSIRLLPPEVVLRLFADGFTLADKSTADTLNILNDDKVNQILEESEIKRALDFAINHDLVEVFLQPIVHASTGKLAGAEALARIRNTEGNLISPGLFIPIAERNGKINQLGKQVFKKCCDFVTTYNMEELGLSFINVNLSPIQFMRSDLDKSLENYMKESGTNPDFIHLEITEESLVDEVLMEKQIGILTDKGFKFVLDDYGKGYSNMSRLRHTPLINIKLDMSIVRDYCENPHAILPNEVRAFLSTGFEITAEGIETEEMVNKMREIGCTYLQGYYFSKPLPIDEFIEKYAGR